MANDFEVVAEPTVGETKMADRCAFIPDAMLGDEGGGGDAQVNAFNDIAQRFKQVARVHVGKAHGCCIAPRNVDNMSDINYDLHRGCSVATRG